MPLLNRIPKLLRRILGISAAALVIFFCGAVPSCAQQPQIATLVTQIAGALQKAHAKKVVVLDFSGPGLKVTQFGRNLANQFSEVLAESGSKFVVVDRTQFLQALSSAKPPIATSSDLDLGPVAKLRQADSVVMGHLESDDNVVSLTIEVRRAVKFHETFSESKEIEAQLAKVLSEVNYPDVGAIGYELPVCLHCPNPQYSAAAFDARAQGLVELSVVIEPNGRADNIVVRKHLREDLDISAEKTVETWIFKPASGPDGRPAAVHMLIEVNFQWH